MSRVAIFAGTRPEAIKVAPIVQAARASNELDVALVSTGQHQEMLESALQRFGLEPDYRLDVMEPGQSLAALTARLTTKIDALLSEQRFDLTLCQGDTTTAFVTALVSHYHQVPVGHVEAGLRSGDLSAPFPEEGNRALVSRLAALHFAPTETARHHLLAEGIDDERIHVTGNTVIDALLREVDRGGERVVSRERPYVLITGHRRESFGPGFESICRAIVELAERFDDHDFVYPVHLNPRVQEPVQRHLAGQRNVILEEPVDYEKFVPLMQGCRVVLTDSGGVQEEAPSLGKPVVVMRDNTERPEGVEAGTVVLVGTDKNRIVEEVSRLLTSEEAYAKMANAVNPYGDGKAAPRIVSAVTAFLKRGH